MLRPYGIRNLAFIIKFEERLSLTQANWSRPSVYPSFAWSGLGNFYHPLVGMLVHLYTWVKGGTLRVKWFSKEHNTAQWLRPGLQPRPLNPDGTNHWAIASPSKFKVRYQTGEIVFHQDIQTTRRELKIRRAAEYFFAEISSVWYIFSIETKPKE